MTLITPLWMIPAAVFLAASLLWPGRRDGDDWHKVIAPPLLAFLRPRSKGRRRFHPALAACALAFAALAGPALPGADGRAFRHAEGWLVMVDVSQSMTLTDIRPSRLAAARDTAIALSQAAGARATGLAVYAGDAFLADPFAFDRRHYGALARSLEHGLIPVEGSDVARALSFAASVVSDAGLAHARVFLLTDTGGISANAIATAAQFAARGHRIDVIAFADESADNPVPADMTAAADLAEAGGGALVQADTLGRVALAQVTDGAASGGAGLALAGMEPAGYALLSHWLLLAALPFVLAIFRRMLS